MYRPRLLAAKLQQLVRQFPVVVVSGARQVGKSTLVARAFPKWSSVLLDPVADVGGARQDPDFFLDNQPGPLVLDEIQFAPELVPAIKRRVDRTTAPGQFILTGSQQWSVLRTAAESLAGRAVFVDLEGFALNELAAAPIDGPDPGTPADQHWLARYLRDPEAFVARPAPRLGLDRSVHEQLWRGFLPTADSLDLTAIPDFHRAYMRTYVERDVRLIADVSDWQQFGRFVQLASALTAQEVNFSQFGRDIGITPKTAQRWLATLKATFQWFELPPYHGSTIKRISGKPKGHIADTGLAAAAQQISSPQALAGHPMAGALFESAVFAEIRKLAATLGTPPAMYHWRTHGGAEVDILLERDRRFFPIEVKLGSQPTRGDTRGLVAFRETYATANVAPGLVVCAAGSWQRIGEREYAMPWDTT